MTSSSQADATFREYFSNDPQVRNCPYPHFARIRDEDGLRYHPDIDAYVVSRHADTTEVLRDPVTFSSKLPFGRVAAQRERRALEGLLAERPELEALIPALKPRRTPTLVNCDPPQHMRQRRLVHASFSTRRIVDAEPWVDALANQLIDMFAAGGEVDLVPRLCIPFPVQVIARMLGVSDDRQADFKRWSDDFMRAAGNDGLTPDVMIAAMRGQAELFAYLEEQIEERRRAPGEDLISSIVAARQPGDEPLSVNEMLAMCSQFLVAGNETTTALIGSALLALARNASLADELRADPDRIAPFLEEVLRLDGPVQGVFRSVTRDTQIGGFPLKAGDQVFVIHGAANRDPAAYPEKQAADTNEAGRHFSFGFGEHFCLGSGLARMEARLAVCAMLRRFSTIALPDGFEPAYAPTYMMRSLVALPLLLEPAR